MASSLIRELLDAGVHFGHQTRRWHPKMRPFLFGSRSGIHIIDLEQTEQKLQEARDFIETTVAKGGIVLFVGTKKQARKLVKETAEKAGMPYVNNRWLGGTLTNFGTIRQNLERLRTLRKQRDEGLFDRISKKDAKQLNRQLEKLEDNFSGLSELEQLPACLFVVDTKREQIAIREAQRLKIPVVAICDSNANPDPIMFPIPGNDDAIRSIRLILACISESVLNARAQEPIVPLEPSPQEPQPAAEDAAQIPSEAAGATDEGNRTENEAVKVEENDKN